MNTKESLEFSKESLEIKNSNIALVGHLKTCFCYSYHDHDQKRRKKEKKKS